MCPAVLLKCREILVPVKKKDGSLHDYSKAVRRHSQNEGDETVLQIVTTLIEVEDASCTMPGTRAVHIKQRMWSQCWHQPLSLPMQPPKQRK